MPKQKTALVTLLVIALIGSVTNFVYAQEAPCQGELFWYNENDESVDPSGAQPGEDYTVMASFDNCQPGDKAVLTNAKDGTTLETTVDDTGYAVVETNGQFTDSGQYYSLQVKNPQQQVLFSRATQSIQLSSSQDGDNRGNPPQNTKQNNENNSNNTNPTNNNPQDTDPNLGPTGFEDICSKPTSDGKQGGLAQCIQRLYLFSLGIGGFIAFAMIVLAGYRYMTAAGNSSQVEGAKEAFASAFIGLVIIFVAFILLNLINPDLVRFPQFQKLELGKIKTPPAGQQNSVTLTITEPANNATFKKGNNILIKAALSGGQGNGVKVVFYRSNSAFGEDTSSPYQATLTNAPEGSYTISVQAFDGSNKVVSAPGNGITIKVNP